MSRPLVRTLATLALLAACGGRPGIPAAPAQVVAGAWRMDERVVVTDFQRVTALARSPDRLFIATEGGLAVLRDAFGRWELPVTREDGYPDSQVLALGWDRRDASLWLATRDGRLLQLDPDGRRWLDSFSLRGTVDRIVAPAADPSRLFVRSGGRWTAFDPFTRQTERVSAGEVQAAIQADFDLRDRAELLDDPSWQAAQAVLGRRDSRRYEVTDVMPSAEAPGEFWVSTYGGFLERYDSFSGAVEPVDYGIVGYGASAVHVDGRGDERVWLAPRQPSDRYGVAATDPELQDWTVWAGALGGFEHRGAPDGPVRAWLSTESGVWAGGDRGLYRYDGERWSDETLGSRSGVAGVTALAAADGEGEGVWVGTGRGLLRVPTAGAPPDRLLLRNESIRALAAHDGALWIGTDVGLLRLGADGEPAAGGLPGRVGALSSYGRRLVAGVGRDVWTREEGADWTRPGPVGALSAPVSAIAVADGVVWIGTNEELVAWKPGSDRLTTYTFAAGDLPAGPRGERAVLDLAVGADGAVWVATPAGAVRLGPER